MARVCHWPLEDHNLIDMKCTTEIMKIICLWSVLWSLYYFDKEHMYINYKRGLVQVEISWECGYWCRTEKNSKKDEGEMRNEMEKIFIGGRKSCEETGPKGEILSWKERSFPFGLGTAFVVPGKWPREWRSRINFLSSEHHTLVNSISRLYHNFFFLSATLSLLVYIELGWI